MNMQHLQTGLPFSAHCLFFLAYFRLAPVSGWAPVPATPTAPVAAPLCCRRWKTPTKKPSVPSSAGSAPERTGEALFSLSKTPPCRAGHSDRRASPLLSFQHAASTQATHCYQFCSAWQPFAHLSAPASLRPPQTPAPPAGASWGRGPPAQTLPPAPGQAPPPRPPRSRAGAGCSRRGRGHKAHSKRHPDQNCPPAAWPAAPRCKTPPSHLQVE